MAAVSKMTISSMRIEETIIPSQVNSMFVHSNKRYQCKKCEFQVTWKSDLTRHHHTIHMGTKSICEQCDFRANLKTNMTRRYQSFHTGCPKKLYLKSR
jgi:hypothetical protein